MGQGLIGCIPPSISLRLLYVLRCVCYPGHRMSCMVALLNYMFPSSHVLLQGI
jgi:hypothetical protein